MELIICDFDIIIKKYDTLPANNMYGGTGQSINYGKY